MFFFFLVAIYPAFGLIYNPSLSDLDEAEYASPETRIQEAAKITRRDNPAPAVFVMVLVTALKVLGIKGYSQCKYWKLYPVYVRKDLY